VVHDDLANYRVGFDNDELTFTRLDLRADSTGFCARVSPTTGPLQDQELMAEGKDLCLQNQASPKTISQEEK